MTAEGAGSIGILWPGDPRGTEPPARENNRLYPMFEALAGLNVDAQPVPYSDEAVHYVREKILQLDGVLVWVNPIFDGHNRRVLDAMLEHAASRGVWVSAHPEIIQKIGTKEVIVRTRELGWGTDAYLYKAAAQFRDEFPPRLRSSGPRVLKQNRGHSGDGVWKVELSSPGIVRVEHAKDGKIEGGVSLREFMARCQEYFTDGGPIIDQAFQPRVSEGMVRCYMVHDEVAGFMHKLPQGDSIRVAGRPGATYPASEPRFAGLKATVESVVPEMQKLLDIETTALPVLWDADFLHGPKTASGEDTYVLCEINVSSVAPFPEDIAPKIARTAAACIRAAKQARG